MVTNNKFLLTVSIQCQETSFGELIKRSGKRKYLVLLSNSLNTSFKKMYGDEFKEFVYGCWGIKD